MATQYTITGSTTGYYSGVLGRSWPTFSEAAEALAEYRSRAARDPLTSEAQKRQHHAEIHIEGRVVSDWVPIPEP